MQKKKARRDEVSEYYRIAPKIVASIDSRPDRALIYRQLCDTYLLPALTAIHSNEYEKAHKIYSSMVLSLRSHCADTLV